MLDKLLLNNQLLANKKKAQRAKVNVISKLVQKLRKIKKLCDKKPDDNKLKTKIKRTEEILLCVKKTKSIDLLKKSLINDKKPVNVITNGNSTSQDVADALLFEHKLISETANQLKETFHLNNSNPGWKDQLLEIGKQRKKKLQGVKKKKLQGVKKKKGKELNNFKQWKEHDSMEELVKKESDVSDPEDRKAITKKDIQQNRGEVDDAPALKSKIKPVIKKNMESPDIKKENSVEHSIDPFFITKTGENYLSTAVVTQSEDVSSEGNFGKKRSKEPKMQHEAIGNNHDNVKHHDSQRYYEHSSWAPKRKLNGIQKFQERKRKYEHFENKEKNTKTKLDKCSVVSNLSNNNNQDREKLHPSWEAKQKMKPIIADFKGKKIVFNDDD